VSVFRVLIPTLNVSSRGTLLWHLSQRMFMLLHVTHTEWLLSICKHILKLTESKIYMKKDIQIHYSYAEVITVYIKFIHLPQKYCAHPSQAKTV
jgi:hypothetical protein